MPKDYSSVFDAHEAGANLNGAQGIAPGSAVQAFRAAPETGVAPSLGMLDPKPLDDLAAMKRDTAMLEVPAIQRFAATSPAHVAATRGDWPNLAKVAETADTWNTLATQDFFAPGKAAGVAFLRDLQRAYSSKTGLIPGFNARDQAMGSVVADLAGLAFSPLSGALNVAARPFAGIPSSRVENGQLIARTREENQANVANIFGTALMGLGVGRAKVPKVGGDLQLPAPESPPIKPAPPGVRPQESELYSNVAEIDAAQVARIEESVAGTQTHSALPALTQEFLDHTPVAGQSAWVDPQAIVDLYAEGHTVLPQFAQQVSEALASGRDVQVPLSAYLADVSGKPYAEQLRTVTRFREEGVSVEEGKGLSAQEEGVTVEDRTLAPPREIALPEDIGPEHLESTRTIAANADVAVEEVFAEQALRSLFTDNKAIGLTKGQFDRYDNMLAEAKAAATERVLERHYRQVRRERTPEWKAVVEQKFAAVEQTLARDPALHAYSELTRGKGLLGEELEEPIKLASGDQLSAYGKDLGLPKSMFSAEGLEPDDAATLLGFNNGAELIRALQTVHALRGDQQFTPFVKGLVEQEATVRTRNALGYDISPEGILAAAREEAVLPQVEDFLISSLRDLADSAGLPFDKETVKAEAKRQFDLLPVREAIRVRSFERGMWKTGNATQIALEKDNWPKALLGRQQQLLNFYQLEASHFLAKKVGIAERKFRKLGKRQSVKGLNQEFLDQIHQYLPRIEVPVKRDLGELLEATQGMSVEQFVNGLLVDNPVFPEVPLARGDVRDMQVQDFWEVREFVYALDKYGREVQTLKLAEGKAEFDEKVEQALANAPPPNKQPPVRMGGRQGFVEKMTSRAVGYDAAHRKIADIGEYLDRGNPQGVFAEVVENPIEDASSVEGRLRRDTYRPVADAFHKIPSEIKRGYNAVLPEHPFGDIEVRRGDIPAIALYVGQESALAKLAEGYGTIAPEVLAFLDAHITEAEVNFVQGVWDRFDELSVPVSETLRAMTGTGLKREENRQWVTPFGTRRGGYWPITYDRALDREVKAREAQRALQMELNPVSQMFMRVAPDRGFAEKRTGYKGPVLIRLSSVADAFDAHIKYAAYAQTVASIRRFINEPRIRDLITTRMGPEYYDQFNPWLDAVVLDYTIGDRGTRGLQALAHQARLNTTISVLGFSYSTGISQVAGLPGAVGLLADNPIEGLGRMASGIVQMGKLGVSGGIKREIFDKSEFMAQRFGQVEPNMTEAMNVLEGLNYTALKLQENYKAVQRASMAYIGWMEFATVSGPTWLAAFSKARNTFNMTEGDAVRYADRIVRKSQGSGRRVDLAAVQRGDGFQRWFYMFQTFFNASYQRMIEAGRAGKEGNYGKAFNLFLWFFVLSPLAAALLTNHGPKDGQPTTMAKWGMQAVFFNLMRPFFLLGNAMGTIDRNLKVEEGHWIFNTNPGNMDFSADPFTRSASTLFEAGMGLSNLAQGKKARRPFQTTMQAAGLLAGIPGGGQIGKTGEYLIELMHGDQRPDSASDLFEGITGGPQKEQATTGRSGRSGRRTGR